MIVFFSFYFWNLFLSTTIFFHIWKNEKTKPKGLKRLGRESILKNRIQSNASLVASSYQ